MRLSNIFVKAIELSLAAFGALLVADPATRLLDLLVFIF